MSSKSSIRHARRNRRWNSTMYSFKQNLFDFCSISIVVVLVVAPTYFADAFIPSSSIVVKSLSKVRYVSRYTQSQGVPSISIDATNLNMSGLFGEQASPEIKKPRPSSEDTVRKKIKYHVLSTTMIPYRLDT